MGIMTRMLRLWKADLHGVMDQLEDKGLLLRQYLREMENSLQQKEARCTKLTQSRRQITRDMDQRHQEIDKTAKDLDLAIAKSKDDIARMLIRKRRSLEATSQQLQQQLDFLDEEHQSIDQLLGQQRLQYDQLKIKAEIYFQQAQTQQHEENLTGIDDLPNFNTPSEEEIELELLQRKELISRGGAA